MSEHQVPLKQARPSPITRRQALRTLALISGTAALTGGAVLTSCGSPTNTSATPVTLVTGDWPFSPIPSTIKKGDTDPFHTSQVAVLQDWLKKNKNVTLKYSAVDLSDDQHKLAAIAGRTITSWYGGFSDGATTRFAGTLGLAAETTQLVKKYDVDSLLADYAKPVWNAKWNVNGKFYGLPGDLVSAGAGLFFRRDIAKQKGLAEPKVGWTWEDFHAFAKAMAQPGKPAMGAPKYMIGYLTNSNQLDILQDGGVLGSVPTPNAGWHQKVNVTPWVDSWKERVSLYRSMVSEKLIDQNATAYPWEGMAVGQMAAGNMPMAPGFSFLLSINPGVPVAIPDMAKKYGKPLSELVGYVPYPYGSNGAYNSSICPDFGETLLSPYLKAEALDKAADLWFYMFFGEGYVNYRAMRYEKTKDPTKVYDYILPSNRYLKNPKVPADVTVENVFGADLVANYRACLQIPVIPQAAMYFKPDKQTPPPDDAHNDLLQELSQSNGDVAAALTKFQNTYNQQTSTLNSSITPDDYKNAAKQYYAALNDFWQKNAPTFYSGDWSTYYNNEVLPALS